MNYQTVKAGSRQLRPSRRHSRLRTMVLYIQGAVMLLFGVGIGAVVGLFISVSRMLPEVTSYSPPEVTRVYSSDNVLLTTFGQENREYVKLDQMPKDLQNAIVAIEDARFYEHAGVDFRGIARAAVENIRGGGLIQGGSTITQQLARNVYLTPRKNLSRKVREAVLAVLIERRYTKPRILELYLNQVYFGSRAYGVEAASKVYFGKSIDKLDLAECALIAALPRAPSKNSPHVNLKRAIERRDQVLDRMVELHYITPEERDKAKAERPRITKPSRYRSIAPYFTDYVREYLQENLRYTEDMVLRGGLRVYTTVNWKMQQEAQRALEAGVKWAKANRIMDRARGNAALVCLEPETGYIRAMVGGADYAKSSFNRAVQAQRQPGSAFKIFVYTAAVDMLGWDANHVIRGSHYTYAPRGARPWSPRNYDGRYYSSLTMKMAVARSVNVPAVRTAVEVGLGNVIRYARLLGVTAEIERYPALAIGGIKHGIRPIEMAAAYGVIASGGYYVQPTPVARVTDSHGVTIDEPANKRQRVLTDRTVGIMDELFRAVVTSGTGRGASSIPGARGKTGTTNNDVDAWFIGYVPGKLVTAIWAGNDIAIPMNHAYGSTLCLPIWKDFMRVALQVYDQARRPKTAAKPKTARPEIEKRGRGTTGDTTPTTTDSANSPQNGETSTGLVTVRICDVSQMLATRRCPSTRRQEFVKGTEPTETCNIHPLERGKPSEGDAGERGGEDDLRLTPPTLTPD